MPVISEMYYYLYEGGAEGVRPPVVLLHGAGGTHLFWPAEVRRLLGYRVYALDLPGHGKSGGCGLQSIEAYAQAVHAWMMAVSLHSAVIVGHSMGSGVALMLALTHPENVLGLGLVGAAGKLRVARDLIENASNPATLATAANLVVERSFGSEVPPAFVAQAGRRLAETRASVFYGDFLACSEFDVTERLAEVRAPALIVVGEEDRMTPVRTARLLAASLPKADLAVISGAGHMVQLEKPREVASALRGFFAGISYY